MHKNGYSPYGNKFANKFKVVFAFILILFLTNSCREFIPSFDIKETEGYIPIYESSQSEVSVEAPLPYSSPGKFYQYSNYILIEELGRGFHIIDNTNSSDPVKKGFFQIPLNSNIAISSGIVYADSGTDLLALDIQPDGTIQISKLANVFTYEQQDKSYPPNSGYYFECADGAKGNVIGWKLETIYNPQCYF